MKQCGNNFKIPVELMGEDVYDTFYIFDNELEAIEYIKNEYNVDIECFLVELHEEDCIREIYGKKNYLRSACIDSCIYLNELMSGQYIIWEAY